MLSEIKVTEKTVSLWVYSGWNTGSYIKLIGSTFPVVPIGTIVEKLSIKVPEGLHSLAFFCRAEGPHQMGSGKTAYLDSKPHLSASLLLSWKDDGKLFVKDDKNMSAGELAKFNSFVRSDVDIFVVNTEKKIAYVSDLLCHKIVDPAWTYKSVSMEALLEYITKKLTMEQLDERATSEQRAIDGLRDLRDVVDKMSREMSLSVKENDFLKKQRSTAITDYNEIIITLMKSERLYKFLKRLPSKFRPKAFDGFVKAIDLLKKSATT